MTIRDLAHWKKTSLFFLVFWFRQDPCLHTLRSTNVNLRFMKKKDKARDPSVSTKREAVRRKKKVNNLWEQDKQQKDCVWELMYCVWRREEVGEKVRETCTFGYGCANVCVSSALVWMYTHSCHCLFLPGCVCREENGYDRPVCCLPRIIAYGLPEASPTADT